MTAFSLRRPFVIVLPLLLLVALPRSSRAASAGGKDDKVIRVRKFEGLGSRALIRTPEYQARTSITRAIKPPSKWGQIILTYDSYPDWIDDLTVQFHALALATEKGQRKYSLYKLTVRYGDIEKGRTHTATAFLHPKALKRFGNLVAVAVEVSHEGKIIATKSEKDAQIPEEWWKKEKVTGSKDVTARSEYLVDRSKSPFALINIDDHEVIR